ncbi:hypothetical protein [Barnesiella intestinihominis]|jgi:hypothetical protein|uniref:hypothetical protein n=1 Tax=Barnesiella intestinihominis TaxID=487174 RepID=UPI003966A98E
MTDQVTSIEQSKRLIELGVPVEKASMVWHTMPAVIGRSKLRIAEEEHVGWMCRNFPGQYAPAFTVADLLGLLPPKISCQDPSDGNFRMRRYMGENGIEWVVDYDRFIANDVSIINALVETIILLVSTKHELNL